CELLPADSLLGFVTVPGSASAEAFGAPPSARAAVRRRAKSLDSIPAPPTASLGVRHLGNPSCVPAAHDWTAPGPNATIPTSGVRLPASDVTVSSAVPVLPRPASNIEPLIPSLLPRPLAQAAMQPASAIVRGCSRTSAAQTGTRFRFPRRIQLRPASFYERR